jgi:hypothetical protein
MFLSSHSNGYEVYDLWVVMTCNLIEVHCLFQRNVLLAACSFQVCSLTYTLIPKVMKRSSEMSLNFC